MLFTHFFLKGENLAKYDATIDSLIDDLAGAPSEEHFASVEVLGQLAAVKQQATKESRLGDIRQFLNNMGDSADLSDIEIKPVMVKGVPAEWVMAENSDPQRRLLYLHGGGFTVGSAKAFRVVTTALARRCGVSVLALDYRLMPEHSRLDGIKDSQKAYRWIQQNGPEGKKAAKQFYVAGDSAGGNLTLSLIAWARDKGLRPVDAAIALSPATDATVSAPSIKRNLETDHALGDTFRKILTVPKWFLLWFVWFHHKARPCDPKISPIHGDLSGLPPVLIQASEAEVLIDDSRRYVNKAFESGSEVTLQTWPHVVHCWHLFEYMLPEAKEAFDHIAAFIEDTATV